jgi:hypothetical protein
MAPALKVSSIAIKSTVSLYIRYWLNLTVNAFATPVSIIILYYLLELYQKVFLEVT